MDITTNNTVYRFPILKNVEIMNCLSEAGIEITENELIEPHRHKDKIKQVFVSLVELGLGLTQDSFSQTPIAEMKYIKSLPYPDLHSDSFPSIKFFLACQKFMHVCGNSDGFSFNDLGAPSPKRLKRQLSAAINFIKFREDRLVLYAELHDQREELLQGREEVQLESVKYKDELMMVKSEAERRWDDLKVIDTDCSEMEGEIGKQNKLQRNLRGESEELKKTANRLKDKIDTAELELKEMDAEERKLLPKVVDSPEHLNKQLKELDVEFVKEKKRLKEEEREAKLAEVRVKNVGKTVGDVEAATRLVDELMEEEKTYTQILEEVKDIQKEIDENCEEVKLSQEVLSGHEVQLEQIGMLWKIWICQLTLVFSFRHVCLPQYAYLIYNPRIEHETEANRKESKIKIEEVQVALRGVNAQLFAVEKDRRHEKDTLEQNEEDLKVIQTIIDEEQAKAEREIKNILSTYKDMEKIILERQEQFNATIKV